MQVIVHPKQAEWSNFLKRPYSDNTAALTAAQEIIDTVKAEGDAALRRFAKLFDGVELSELCVTEDEQIAATQGVPDDLKKAIQQAKKNIETFHQAQRIEVKKIETMPGISCWQKSVAIEKVGLYIPGGTAPLFSTVLMLGIPAKLAGCNEMII